jgi:hypothetical protein
MDHEHYQHANPLEISRGDEMQEDSNDLDRTVALVHMKKVQEEIHQSAVDHGFWKDYDRLRYLVDKYGVEQAIPRDTPELMIQLSRAMLMVSEISEAVEARRDKDAADDKLPQFSGFTVELADCMIRILDMAHQFRLPVLEAMFAKIDYNKSRPFMHGKLI